MPQNDSYSRFLKLKDGAYLYFGDGNDANFYADGTGATFTGALGIVGDVTITGDLDISTEDIFVDQGQYIWLDGESGGEYIWSATAGELDLVSSTKGMKMTSSLTSGTQVGLYNTSQTLTGGFVGLNIYHTGIVPGSYDMKGLQIDMPASTGLYTQCIRITTLQTKGEVIDIQTDQTLGEIIDASFTETTLAGAMTGFNLDMSTNVTHGSQTMKGLVITMPSGSTSTGIEISANCATGISVDSTTASESTTTGSIHTDGGLGVAGAIFAGGAITSTDTTSGFVASGAATQGLLVSGSCTSGINISVAQSDETGLDEACVFKHGTYSNVLAYGTQTTAHLVLKSTCISVASTGYYVFGDVLRITSSAPSTGHLIGTYTYMSLGHTTNNTYAVRGRVDVTATAELGLTNALMGEINVTAGTITQGTGGSINGLHVDMNVTAGATIAQPIHGILVDTSGIAVDIAGDMIGIKIAHAGGSNYLDYGLQFSNCFHNATAVEHFELTQGNVATAMLIETGAHTLTTALSLSGIVTNVIYFAGTDGAEGATHGTYSSGHSTSPTGTIRVNVAGNPKYIYLFTDDITLS